MVFLQGPVPLSGGLSADLQGQGPPRGALMLPGGTEEPLGGISAALGPDARLAYLQNVACGQMKVRLERQSLRAPSP